MTAWTRLLAACTGVVLGVAGCGGGDDGSVDSPRTPTTAALEGLASGWSELPAPPEVRIRAATAWTGEELLVWGGFVFTGSGDKPEKDDGFVFDARAQEWDELAVSPLARRAFPASAWTGEEFLIWGGSDGRQERFFGDGAAYHPTRDTWRRLPVGPIGARAPLSVWTGREFIVWGTALRMEPRPRDGAAYDPAENSWRTIAKAPIDLTDATAVWTGREMIVFGAALHGGNFPETKTAIGAAYNPETDTWRKLPRSALSPQASTAAWNGREMIAWDYLNGTAAYDPAADTWRKLRNVPLDAGECVPESVPVGNHVFGDYCGLMAAYERGADSWRDISRPDFVGWGFEIVAADPVVLLLGRNADTGEERMLAYRP